MKKNITFFSSCLLFLICSGCPQTTPVVTPTESPTSQPSVTASPSLILSPLPTATIISATSTPLATPVPFPTPTLMPSPSPSPSALQYGTITGKVWDIDQGRGLDDATMTARSLTESVPYNKTTKTDTGGLYKFTDVPIGVNIEVNAHKADYTTRIISVILVNGAINQTVDFKDEVTGLSTKPEVIDMFPVLGSADNKPTTAISITFNKGMNRESVENAFAVISDKETDYNIGCGAKIPGYQIGGLFTKPIFTRNSFNPITWEPKKVTFNFRDGIYFPVDKDNTGTFRLIFSYNNNVIKDSTGTEGRQTIIGDKNYGVFNIKGDIKWYAPFSIKGELKTFSVSRIDAYDGGTGDDKIIVTFTNRMFIILGDGSYVCGGAGGDVARAAAEVPAVQGNRIITGEQAVVNYSLKVNGAGSSLSNAVFNADDYTNKTVILTGAPATFKQGDNIELTVAQSLVDPANNSCSGSNIFAGVVK